MESAPIGRTRAGPRGGHGGPPGEIATAQVVEHGLRHSGPGWRADDPVVAAELPPGWRTILATYAPEPFRNLG